MENNPTNFAKVNARGVVLQVIVAEQSFIDTGAVGNPKNWILLDQEKPAGIGYKYNKKLKTFTAPKPCVFCFYMRRFFSNLIGRPCKDCPKK